MKRLLAKLDDTIFSSLLWATSTKPAFYALSLLILFAVIVSPPTSIQGWLLVIVSEYYQGVALPGLGAASKLAELAAKQEGSITRKLLQETHDAAMKQMEEIKQMHKEQASELAEIKSLHQELHQFIGTKSRNVF